MKHLRKFNESWKDKADRLQEICEEILINLIDNDFDVKVINFNKIDAISISNIGESNINWNDVKDSIITLLTLIQDDYKLLEVKIWFSRSDCYKFSVQDIIDEKSNIGKISKEAPLRFIEISFNY